MKKNVSNIVSFLLIFGTMAVVLVIGFNSQDVGSSVAALRSLGLIWIVLAIAAYGLFISFDAFSMWYFLRNRGCRIPFHYMLFVAITGLYYSNITPGASGGQPMQIYYLHKKNVPLGLATSTLVVRFFSFQFMLTVLSTVFWVINGPFVAEQLGGNMWIFIVGYVYNTVMVSAIVLVALRKGIVRFIMNGIIKLGVKLRLIKNPEASRAKCEDSLTAFHDSVLMLRDHPKELVAQLLIGAAQLMALMAILYVVHLGLGLSGATYSQITALDLVHYVSSAYIPTPGASGAQEVAFSIYFGNVFPDGIRFAALLVWRFFTYYFSLIIGAITTVVYSLHSRKNRSMET